MTIDIANNTDLIISFSCVENDWDRTKLESADFTEDDIVKVNAFINMQGATSCCMNEVAETMSIYINAPITFENKACFSEFNSLSTEDKTIVTDFISVLISKIV